jgi:hypothetical protein
MNKNIEAVQTPPIVNRVIAKWGVVTVIATIVSRWWLSHHVDADVTLRAVVALAPIPIFFMCLFRLRDARTPLTFTPTVRSPIASQTGRRRSADCSVMANVPCYFRTEDPR